MSEMRHELQIEQFARYAWNQAMTDRTWPPILTRSRIIVRYDQEADRVIYRRVPADQKESDYDDT